MSRPLIATIESVTGTPHEGLQVDALNGTATSELTDAGGVCTLHLEPGQYTIPLASACIVDGTAYRAGTVLRLTVPEGEDPLMLGECVNGADDASPAALLALIADLAARVASLEGP